MELIIRDKEAEEELTIINEETIKEIEEKTRREIETLKGMIESLGRFVGGSLQSLEQRVKETEDRLREVEGHLSDVTENHEGRVQELEAFEERMIDDMSGGSLERSAEMQEEINRGSQILDDIRRTREPSERQIPEIPKPPRWSRTRKINLGEG